MNWLTSLLSNNEDSVCSISVCGIACVAGLIGVTIWHPDWNPLPYSTAAASIIGTIAGGKRLRDGLKPPVVSS